MQEEADLAIEAGATTPGEIILIMKATGMLHIDEGWIERYCYKIFGPPSKPNRRDLEV